MAIEVILLDQREVMNGTDQALLFHYQADALLRAVPLPSEEMCRRRNVQLSLVLPAEQKEQLAPPLRSWAAGNWLMEDVMDFSDLLLARGQQWGKLQKWVLEMAAVKDGEANWPEAADEVQAKIDLQTQLGNHHTAAQLAHHWVMKDTGDATRYVARARALERLGLLSAAETDFATAIRVTDDGPLFRTHRAAYWGRQQKRTLARADLDTALTQAPNHLQALQSRADFYVEDTLFQEALTLYDRMVMVAPQDAKGYTGRIGCYVALGRAEEAFANAESLFDIGHEAAGLAGRGFIELDLGQMDEALKDLQRAALLDPTQPKYSLMLASTQQAMGQYYDALDVLTQVIKRFPNNIEAYLERSNLLMEFSAYRRAREDVETALLLDPHHPMAAEQKVKLFMKTGWLVEEPEILHAIGLDSTMAEYHRFLGFAHQGMNDLDQALLAFSKAVTLDSSAEHLYDRGVVLYRQDRNREALRDYGLSYAMDTTFGLAFLGIADCQRELGLYEEAMVNYQKVPALDSTLSSSALHNLGYLFIETEQYEACVPVFDSLIAYFPDTDAYPYNNRAICLRELGRFEEALADIEIALERHPRNAWAYVNRGKLYLAEGNLAKARKDFQKAYYLNPDYEEAREMLEALDEQ